MAATTGERATAGRKDFRTRRITQKRQSSRKTRPKVGGARRNPDDLRSPAIETNRMNSQRRVEMYTPMTFSTSPVNMLPLPSLTDPRPRRAPVVTHQKFLTSHITLSR